MGSRRAARPSRSHARPRGGLRTRGTALALGAVTLTAGVGITLAVTDGDDGGASDRVTANAADRAPNAEDAAGGAAPLASASASPSVTASGSPSESAEPEKKPKKTASPTTSAAKAPAPASKTPVRATKKSGGDGSGGNGSSGGGSGSAAGSGSGSGSGTGSDSGATGGAEAQVLALVNEERAAAGCSPVTANDRLTRAADDYSDVMASSGVMSHTGPDGSTMASRVEAAGYQWSTLGENIARGQADAASVMDSWMNSPGHRANILNCSFKELGVGVHFGDGGPWWTQDFGTGR
ncbi:CAP domain-containing protein [Streptomyces coelicoflavus]|uniref:CAP domain-containing protein n=1 Tax=Streptomyces coelicoflavus TaxID=285562 RepID=UPI0032458BEC